MKRVGTVLLSLLLAAGLAGCAESQADVDAANGTTSQSPKESDDTTTQAPAKPLASVVGGKYDGTDDSGYGKGTFTVHNDSDKPLKAVSLTVAKLDASGNIVSETYPQLQSDLQPGQSGDLEFDLSPEDLGKVQSVQGTKLSWMLSDDGDGAQQVTVKTDPVNVK